MTLESAEIISLLLLFTVVVFATLARKLETPYPIVLVIGGLLLGFVPGMPHVPLNPDVIFLVFLPPLLYGAAWNTSWDDFRYNLTSIAFLAIGLVAFTVAAVALIAPLVLPGFDWRVGFVLGAVVASTDSIAATSIARRVGLPKRIVDVLEGESLANDATGLLALEFGTAIVIFGQVPTIGSAILRLTYLGVAGTLIGLLIARIVEWFEVQIDDAPIEIAISVFVPYSAYLAGELIHASGVLSVVAAGLYLGRKSSRFFSPSVRLQATSVWNALVFILNGFVFILIGLQLPYVLGEIGGFTRSQLLLYGAAFSALLIVLRLAWTFPGAHLAYLVRIRILKQNEVGPGARQVFVVGWTGMRGVIALAAAISLPRTLANGAPFPQRSLIIFLTFSAILVTLVLQGLTLPSVVRALGIAGTPGVACEQDEARGLIIEAALAYLDERRAKDDASFAPIYDDFEEHYRQRLASLECVPATANATTSGYYSHYLDISRALLDVERQTAMRLRGEGRISYDFLRELERELDLSATRLSPVSRKTR
jgi:monovalent cation/hydrogen antiporter